MEGNKMSLGSNIQYLRKQKKVTQEKFAEEMHVSRQTVSRWEADEVIPELQKLTELCNYFSCKLDSLVRENISELNKIYSDIIIKRFAPFQMARYVMLSPNPEDDVMAYMDRWASNSGLLTAYPLAMKIGWDFPYVSQELQNRFGIRGYVSAYVLPSGFKTAYPGVEYAEQLEADYAVVSITDPFAQPFERIPNAYKKILDYLQANNFKAKPQDNVLSCFEHIYEVNGITYMDVYVNVVSVTKVDAYSHFSS